MTDITFCDTEYNSFIVRVVDYYTKQSYLFIDFKDDTRKILNQININGISSIARSDREILQKNYNISIESFKNTKACIITYLFGIVPNMDEILAFKNDDIKIIEDFSQCLNGKFKQQKIGTFSDISIYSCSSIKTIDTFGGGLLLTNNDIYFKEIIKSNVILGALIRKTQLRLLDSNKQSNELANEISNLLDQLDSKNPPKKNDLEERMKKIRTKINVIKNSVDN